MHASHDYFRNISFQEFLVSYWYFNGRRRYKNTMSLLTFVCHDLRNLLFFLGWSPHPCRWQGADARVWPRLQQPDGQELQRQPFVDLHRDAAGGEPLHPHAAYYVLYDGHVAWDADQHHVLSGSGSRAGHEALQPGSFQLIAVWGKIHFMHISPEWVPLRSWAFNVETYSIWFHDFWLAPPRTKILTK